MKKSIGEERIEVLDSLKVTNPYSGDIVGEVPCANLTSVRQAIISAQKGAQLSKGLTAFKRSAILEDVVKLLEERKEEFAQLIISEGIKTIREARKEVDRCMSTLKLSAEESSRINGETLSFDSVEGSESKHGYFVKEPLGIITAITPFNDPLNLVAHKLGPAIASGNAVLLKPSDYTPLTAIKLVELFYEAGLPTDIINIITGPIENFGDLLVTDPSVAMVSFTGGLAAAEAISKVAGLKKMSMELGGNAPVIIMDDIDDIDSVAQNCLEGVIWAAGQNCVGVKRIYVQETIFSAFKDKLTTLFSKVKLGPQEDIESDLGPIISENALTKIQSQINELIESGGALIIGGIRIGNCLSPTIIHTPISNELHRQMEIFGPVVIISSFIHLDQAIEAANDSPFGLHAGIFTNSLSTAHKAAKCLQFGGVLVNNSSDFRLDMMPFGGVRSSGIGREGVKYTIEEMTTEKVICFSEK